MIVIRVDVHKCWLTAVAVHEVGRPLAERTCAIGDGVVEWARSLAGGERLWAAGGLPSRDPYAVKRLQLHDDHDAPFATTRGRLLAPGRDVSTRDRQPPDTGLSGAS